MMKNAILMNGANFQVHGAFFRIKILIAFTLTCMIKTVFLLLSIMIKLFLPTLCIFLASCEAVIDNRGYNNDNINTAKIIIGKTTADDVQNLLGSPTTLSDYVRPGQKWTAWLYITKRTATTSFFKPKVLSQKTVTVVFDENKIVRDIKEYASEGIAELEPNCDQTTTSTYEENVGKGIFGSFGRQLNSSPKKNT